MLQFSEYENPFFFTPNKCPGVNWAVGIDQGIHQRGNNMYVLYQGFVFHLKSLKRFATSSSITLWFLGGNSVIFPHQAIDQC